MKRFAVFFIFVFLQVACNYYSFGFLSAIGTSAKPNPIMLKIFTVINYILWMPLGLIGHTKYGMVLEWNYPLMVIVNAFLAVGIIYFLVSLLVNK